MNIEEFRQKYPQYDALTDQDLASRLHKKYYPQLDFGDFSERIGLSTPDTTPQPPPLGGSSLLTADQSSRQTPSQDSSTLGRRPSMIKNIGKTVPYAAISTLKGVTEPFILEPLEALGINTKKLVEEAQQYWKPELGEIPDVTISFEEGKPTLKKTKTPISQILGSTAEGAGFMVGAAGPAMKAGEAITALPAIEKAARPFYRKILAGMIGGALTGKGDVDETLQSAALFGAFEAVPAVINGIKNSTAWRKATIKERGVLLQSLDETMAKNPQMTEGQILRIWDNPQWREQTLKERIIPGEPTIEVETTGRVPEQLLPLGKPSPEALPTEPIATELRPIPQPRKPRVGQDGEWVEGAGEIQRPYPGQGRIPPPAPRLPVGKPSPEALPTEPIATELRSIPQRRKPRIGQEGEWVEGTEEIQRPYPGQERIPGPMPRLPAPEGLEPGKGLIGPEGEWMEGTALQQQIDRAVEQKRQELEGKPSAPREGAVPEKAMVTHMQEGELAEVTPSREQMTLKPGQKVQQEAGPKNFRSWVKKTGGINPQDKTWKGELSDIRWTVNPKGKKIPTRGFPMGFWSKTSRGMDERVMDAIEAGWLPKGSTEQDFMDLIKTNPTIKYTDASKGLESVDISAKGEIAPKLPGKLLAIPTEKIKPATTGEQGGFLPKAGETMNIEDAFTAQHLSEMPVGREVQLESGPWKKTSKGWIPKGKKGVPFSSEALAYKFGEELKLRTREETPKPQRYGERVISGQTEKKIREPENRLWSKSRKIIESEEGAIKLNDIAEAADDLKKIVKDSRIGFKDDDISILEEHIRLPHWRAKDDPQFKKIYDIQCERDANRNMIRNDFIEALLPALKLKGKANKTLESISWKGDILRGELGDTGLKKLSQAVREGYLSLREVLNYIWYEDMPQFMRSLGFTDNEIQQYRRQFGKVTGYMPHERKGKYHVKATEKGKPGEVLYREDFDDILATISRGRISLKAGLKKAKVGKEYPESTITTGKSTRLPEEVYFQISPAAEEQIINVAMKKVKAEDKGAIEKALKKAVAEVIQSRGFMAHGIPRKGIPGYDMSNWKEAVINYVSGYAGFKTKLQAAAKFNDALAKIDAVKSPNKYQYASKYIHDVMRNSEQWDKTVDKFRGLMFYKYLGGVVKSAALQLTQNYIAGVPRLSVETKWATLKITKEMTAAAGDVLKSLYDKNAKGKRLSKNVMDGLMIARKKDIISDQYTEELMGYHMGRYGTALRKFSNSMRYIFGKAEIYNRETLYVTAYRIGVNEKGMTHHEAMDFAENIVLDVHFKYGKSNLPPFARGGKAATAARGAYTFRTYTHNLLSLYRSLLKEEKGVKGKIAVGKGLLAILAFGGVMGMPFYLALEKAVQKLTGKNIRSEIVKKAGHLKDLALYGLPGMLGVDLTGSISIELPTSIEEVGGVVSQVPKDIYNSIQDLARGDFKRLTEDLPVTPNVLKYYMAAKRMEERGVTTRSGTPILDDEGNRITLTRKERIWKSIGFQPTKVSEVWRKSQARKGHEEFYQNKKRNLSDQYVIELIEAMNKGPDFEWPTEKAIKLEDEIDKLNESLPADIAPINPINLLDRANQRLSEREMLRREAVP